MGKNNTTYHYWQWQCLKIFLKNMLAYHTNKNTFECITLQLKCCIFCVMCQLIFFFIYCNYWLQFIFLFFILTINLTKKMSLFYCELKNRRVIFFKLLPSDTYFCNQLKMLMVQKLVCRLYFLAHKILYSKLKSFSLCHSFWKLTKPLSSLP